MDKQDVVAEVIQAVRRVQQASGRPVGDIGTNTRPVGDLDEFDSLNGLEAVIVLSEALDYELPSDIPFVRRDTREGLTVGEIADVICSMIATEAVTHG